MYLCAHHTSAYLLQCLLVARIKLYVYYYLTNKHRHDMCTCSKNIKRKPFFIRLDSAIFWILLETEPFWIRLDTNSFWIRLDTFGYVPFWILLDTFHHTLDTFWIRILDTLIFFSPFSSHRFGYVWIRLETFGYVWIRMDTSKYH